MFGSTEHEGIFDSELDPPQQQEQAGDSRFLAQLVEQNTWSPPCEKIETVLARIATKEKQLRGRTGAEEAVVQRLEQEIEELQDSIFDGDDGKEMIDKVYARLDIRILKRSKWENWRRRPKLMVATSTTHTCSFDLTVHGRLGRIVSLQSNPELLGQFFKFGWQPDILSIVKDWTISTMVIGILFTIFSVASYSCPNATLGFCIGAVIGVVGYLTDRGLIIVAHKGWAILRYQAEGKLKISMRTRYLLIGAICVLLGSIVGLAKDRGGTLLSSENNVIGVRFLCMMPFIPGLFLWIVTQSRGNSELEFLNLNNLSCCFALGAASIFANTMFELPENGLAFLCGTEGYTTAIIRGIGLSVMTSTICNITWSLLRFFDKKRSAHATSKLGFRATSRLTCKHSSRDLNGSSR